MVFDLRELKEILNREVIEPMDHRFLNREVPPFDRVVPTTENVAIEIWRRLRPEIDRRECAVEQCPVVRNRGFVCGLRRRGVKLTRRYRFAASHRLDVPAFSAEENRRLFGKCNNPYGHGHDYVLDVTVEGSPDAFRAGGESRDAGWAGARKNSATAGSQESKCGCGGARTGRADHGKSGGGDSRSAGRGLAAGSAARASADFGNGPQYF